MEDTLLKVNAKTIGHDATVNSLRHLLVDQFRVASAPEAIKADDPLFSAGVGLSSIEGMELLTALEKKYGVVIQDLEYWVDEAPTVDGVARYLVANSPAERSD